MRLLAKPSGCARRAYNPIVFAALLLALKRRTVAADSDPDADADPLGDADDMPLDEDEDSAAAASSSSAAVCVSKRGGNKRAPQHHQAAVPAGEALAPPESVGSALDALVAMLDVFPLADFRDSVAQLADTLAALVQLPHELGGGKQTRCKKAASQDAWEGVSRTAAKGILALLDASRGPAVETSQWVLRALLPAALMTYAGTTHTPVPAPLLATAARAAKLMHDIAAQSEELSERVDVSLQHVCVGAAAGRKVEYRSQAATVITTVIPALAPAHRQHFLQFVCKLSKSAAVRNRRCLSGQTQFAVCAQLTLFPFCAATQPLVCM